MARFIVDGATPAQLLSQTTHAPINHAGISGIGNLHNGAGPGGTTNHATLNHAGIMGIPAGMQSTIKTIQWTNSASGQSTGSIGFTPTAVIAICVGYQSAQVLAHSSTQTTFSVGVASSSASSSIAQGLQCGAVSDDDQSVSMQPSTIAGLVAMANDARIYSPGTHQFFTNGRAVTMTALNSSGMTLTPTGVITAIITLLVIG